MGQISLLEIISVIEELKQKILKYREELSSNEMLVRYALVDSLLRALGWNIEDPEQVVPEYRVSERSERPDYALWIKKIQADKPVLFVEARPLGGITDDIIREKLKYLSTTASSTQ